MCRKVENTVFGSRKWLKSKSEKSDRSANPTLYIVLLYDFAYKSVWIDLKENLDVSLLFYAIFSKKRQNTVFGNKKWLKSKSEKSDRSGTQKFWVVSLYDFN